MLRRLTRLGVSRLGFGRRRRVGGSASARGQVGGQQLDLPGPGAEFGEPVADGRLGQRRDRSPGQPADTSPASRFWRPPGAWSATAATTSLARRQPGRGGRVLVPPARLGRHRVRVGRASATAAAARSSGSCAALAQRAEPVAGQPALPRAAEDGQRGQLGLGLRVGLAAAMMAASGSIRPGATSRSAASRSRACQSARTSASWRRLRRPWMPDVRRHGSARGAGAGAAQDRRELLLGPVQLAGRSQLARAAPRAARSAARRPARRRPASRAAAAGWTSRRPSGPSPARCPRYCSTMVPSATRSEPSSRPASSVSNSRRGRMPSSARQGRSWLAACRIHSASASAASIELRSGNAIGSIRTVPAPARGAAAPGRPAGCSGSPRPARRRWRPGRCRRPARWPRPPARLAVRSGSGVPVAGRVQRLDHWSGCAGSGAGVRLRRQARPAAGSIQGYVSAHRERPRLPEAARPRCTAGPRRPAGGRTGRSRSRSTSRAAPAGCCWTGRARRRTGSRWSG